MERRRDKFKNAVFAVGSDSSALFGEKRHGVALVEQAQFASRVARGRRIEEYAAAKHVTVEIGDERSDIARRVGASGGRVGFLAIFEVFLHSRREIYIISLIYRVQSAVRRCFDEGVREAEFAYGCVEGESVDAVSRRVDQHGRRSVDYISGCDLIDARLQEFFLRGFRSYRGEAAVDRKYRADRNVNIDVRGAVERVHADQVFAVVTPLLVKQDYIVVLFRCHAAAFAAGQQFGHKRVVRIDIQFLLLFALHVHRADLPQNVGQSRFVHLAVNLLGRYPDMVQKSRQLSRSAGKLGLFLNNKLIQSSYFVHDSEY